MANFNAKVAFNINKLNMHSLADYDAMFFNNANEKYNGITYEDVLIAGGGDTYFGGKGVTISSSGSVTGGTVTGFLSEVETTANGWTAGWWIEKFSYSAKSLYAAVKSSSTTDDFAVISSVFAGDDTIKLSKYADSMKGYAGNDKMYGYAGNDTLDGGAGNDLLDGGTGADKLLGGTGNDTYIVDNAKDTVTEASGAGTDTVKSSVSWTLGSNVENLTLTGSSAINGTGNTLANAITGNSAANTLNGGSGNDTINGGLGKDTLIGGSGKDNFVFNTKLGSSNIDTLKDFSAKDDTIRLENAIFTKLTKTGTLSSANFYANASGKAHDANDYIVYETGTGKLFYDVDGNGSKAAVQFAVIGSHPTITAADFVVI